MNRTLTNLAYFVAAADLICFALFLALPALALESSVRSEVGEALVCAALILAVFSASFVTLLLKTDPEDGGSKLSSFLRKISALILGSFALFVCAYLVIIFYSGV